MAGAVTLIGSEICGCLMVSAAVLSHATVLCCACCRGIVAVILAFVLFGVTSMPDGPFLRPHPGNISSLLVAIICHHIVAISDLIN